MSYGPGSMHGTRCDCSICKADTANDLQFCIYEDCDQEPDIGDYCGGHHKELVADGLLPSPNDHRST